MSIDISTFSILFDEVIAHVAKDFSTLRTGKASIQLLDDVFVEAYGSKMKLNEVASMSVPDPSLIVVAPWDKSIVGAIEKAIASAQINLNPIVSGDQIKVPVPQLSKETRLEMVKTLHQKGESSRVMVRSVRNDAKKEIEAQEGESGISEDDISMALEELEKLTKEYIEKIDQLVSLKEKELLSI